MQPQPPTVPPDGREAVDVANPRKAAKYCTPDPSCGLFGPTSYDLGGRTSTEKQRAPINTTPTLAVSSIVYMDLSMHQPSQYSATTLLAYLPDRIVSAPFVEV